MGPVVLDAGASQPDVHLYAHCLPGRPGGVTLLAINTSRTEAQSLDLANAARAIHAVRADAGATDVQLNGRALTLRPGDALPDF